MSKFRALIVSTILATSLFGGALTVDGGSEAAPAKQQRGGSQWCC